MTEACPEAEECKVAATHAGAACVAACLAAARRIGRILQEPVGHVGGSARAVAPRCRARTVGACACCGKVHSDLDAPCLIRVGGARVPWRAVHPRAGPIARANVVAAAAGGAARIRVDRWRVGGGSHLCADDASRRPTAAWTACIRGEDADGRLLSRDQLEKGREQEPHVREQARLWARSQTTLTMGDRIGEGGFATVWLATPFRQVPACVEARALFG